jgi:hypothetical protein
MLNRALFPLRTVVGAAVPIAVTHAGSADVSVLAQSESATQLGLQYHFKHRSSLAPALQDPEYQLYFPSYASGQNQIVAGPGVSNLPPPDLPFSPEDSAVSLMVLASGRSDATPSSLEVTLRIKLQRKALVGGIVYAGHPFIPSIIGSSGENASNFGVPRELRLAPLGFSQDGNVASANGAYLDAETHVTRQELLSHSGVHFLCCDPTLTDTLTLTLSNWPQFVGRVETNHPQPRQQLLRFGFLVPCFYVFEYHEGTRYRPHVPFGLLAARSTPMALDIASEIGEDVELILAHKGKYFPLTPASLCNGPRTYQIPADTNFAGATLSECYVSSQLAKDKQTVLYLEQAQEYSRCLSGLRVLAFSAPASVIRKDPADPENRIAQILPAFHLNQPNPDPGNLSSLHLSPIRVRVWEIDPPEGVSPTQVELGSKYTLLLADHEPATLAAALLPYREGIRFRRATSARYLAVELINRASNGDRLVVPVLSFVQSAHVAVSARPSRFQRVHALNFRLVGDRLGEDLSRIGGDGFHFAVEHWNAGERKAVLFQALSLFDLLHVGVGRLQVNARRRAVELEVSEYGPDINKRLGDSRLNFDERASKNLSHSWHRTEMGRGLQWPGDQDIGPDLNPNFEGNAGFVSVSNQETRTHVRYLYPDGASGEWNAAQVFANLLSVAFGSDFAINQYNASQHSGTHELMRGFERAWSGYSPNSNGLQVTGTTSVVQSPFCVTAVANDQIHNLVNGLSEVIQIVTDAMNGRAIDPVALTDAFLNATRTGGAAALFGSMLIPGIGGLLQLAMGSMLALNGLTITPSATVGGFGATFGAAPGNLMPVITQSATLGNQGTISHQASESNFCYSQSLATGGENSNGTVFSLAGLMKRQVTRAEVPDNQSRVRGAEVAWQDQVTDVVSGAIPLDIVLPALATKDAFRTSDESIRIRLGSGVGAGITVDFWFDVTEEMVRDDH